MSIPIRIAYVRWVLWCCVVLLVCLLIGCERDSLTKFVGYDRARMLRLTVSEDDESFAHNYIENIRQRRFELVETALNPGVSKSAAEDNLAKMAAMFPSREPASSKLVVGNVVHHRDSSTTSSLLFEYEFAPASQSRPNPSEWVLAEMVIEKTGGERSVKLVTFTPVPESLEEVNAFTLEGKGFSQYAVLLLAVCAVALSAYTFVQCIRTKSLRRRWAWLILILIGVCKLTMNWTTGQCFFTPLAVNVIPSSAFCTAYGPWIVSVSIPVGAIAFLIFRSQLLTSRPDGRLGDQAEALVSQRGAKTEQSS